MHKEMNNSWSKAPDHVLNLLGTVLWLTASMATSGRAPLVFIDRVTADRSIRMNSEVYRDKLSGLFQLNATELIVQHFTPEMNNHPNHRKSNGRFFEGKEMEYSSVAESVT